MRTWSGPVRFIHSACESSSHTATTPAAAHHQIRGLLQLPAGADGHRRVVALGQQLAERIGEVGALGENDLVEPLLVAIDRAVVGAVAVAAAEAERQGRQVDRTQLEVLRFGPFEQPLDAIEHRLAGAPRAEQLGFEQVGPPVSGAAPRQLHEDFVGRRDHDVLRLPVVLHDGAVGMAHQVRLLTAEGGEQPLARGVRDLRQRGGRRRRAGRRHRGSERRGTKHLDFLPERTELFEHRKRLSSPIVHVALRRVI